MAVNKLFEGSVDYPAADSFGDLPEGFQFQPENKSRYKGNGTVLTLDEAFGNIDHLQPESKGCESGC